MDVAFLTAIAIAGKSSAEIAEAPDLDIIYL